MSPAVLLLDAITARRGRGGGEERGEWRRGGVGSSRGRNRRKKWESGGWEGWASGRVRLAYRAASTPLAKQRRQPDPVLPGPRTGKPTSPPEGSRSALHKICTHARPTPQLAYHCTHSGGGRGCWGAAPEQCSQARPACSVGGPLCHQQTMPVASRDRDCHTRHWTRSGKIEI